MQKPSIDTSGCLVERLVPVGFRRARCLHLSGLDLVDALLLRYAPQGRWSFVLARAAAKHLGLIFCPLLLGFHRRGHSKDWQDRQGGITGVTDWQRVLVPMSGL